MERNIAERAVKSIAEWMGEDHGYSAEEYSGRGMFGAKTWAITGDKATVICYAIGAADVDGDFDPSDLSQDSMGLGVVIY